MGYLSCKAEPVIATSNSQIPSSNSIPYNPEKSFKIQHFEYSNLDPTINGFSDQNLFGKGSHGYVYKAAIKKPSRSPMSCLTPPPPSSSSPLSALDFEAV